MKNVVMANVIPVCLSVQVSALDQELIEVDPDTKEMLKLLVSLSVTGQQVQFLRYLLSSYSAGA